MKSQITDKITTDVLIVPTFKGKASQAFTTVNKLLDGVLVEIVTRKEFSGARKTSKHVITNGQKFRAVILVGLGEPQERSITRFNGAIDLGVRCATSEGYTSASVMVDETMMSIDVALPRATESALITARAWNAYKIKSKEGSKELATINIVVEKVTPQLQELHREAVDLAHAVNAARDLQDTPAADMCPEDFAQAAKKMAKKNSLKCTIFDEKQLKKMKYNTILAVGNGSSRKPRMVLLEYRHPKAKKTICLVGKGVVFDTGGYNLKPTGYMEDMGYDMSGAAIVFGTMQALASLKPKVNVIGIMGMAENMVGPDAYRPSDIITTPHGISVEVGNTDAEGRLVLADCLHHATTLKPHAIVDFATLTGACVVALGSTHSGILGTDKKLIDTITSAGSRVGELYWELPLHEDHTDDIQSKVADIKNVGYQREAGTITAAEFLKQFVDDISWAHVDVAGTAMVARHRHFTAQGGTGWGVRSMVEWLRKE